MVRIHTRTGLFLIALVFVLLHPVTLLAANKTYIAPAAERQKAQQLTQSYEALEAQVPKHFYDVDALAERLDYEVKAAADFVRDDIQYDPYLGVMRGPQGTISARAGSSWDQAVLLAALINSMVGEALIVKGTLGPEDVDRLLLGSFGQRATPEDPLSINTVSETLGPFLPASRMEALKAEALEINSDEYNSSTEIKSLADRLEKALNDAGVTLEGDPSERLDKLRENLSEEYVWVRYRDTPNDPWTDIHPAFGSAIPPEIEPEKFIADTVPKDRLHEIEIRLSIERKANGRFERIDVMTPYRRPAANLAATQINLAIAPSSDVTSEGDVGYFTPILNNAKAPGAKVFSMLGLTASADDAAAGPDIFRLLGEKAAKGLGALNSATGDEDSTPRLTGVILEIIHISPGGTETKESRRLVDFRESVPENPAAQITFMGVLDTNVGPENIARALETLFASEAIRAKSLPYIGAYLNGRMTAEEAVSHPAFSSENLPKIWTEMLLMGEAFNGDVQDNERVVRTAPMVSMTRIKRQTHENGLFVQVVDILRDETLALRRDGDQVLYDTRANLEQGLRFTLAEQALAPGTKSLAWTDMPIQKVLTDPETVLKWVDDIGASDWLSDRMLADLEMGNALVQVKNTTDSRWWRVNMQTGQVLGMGLEGGVELTEYSKIDFALGVYTLVMLKKGDMDCIDTYPRNIAMQNCCRIGNVMMTAATAGAGRAVSSQAAALVDDAYQAALGYLTLMTIWEAQTTTITQVASNFGTDPICTAIVE
ncbi:hypothetical protein [Litorimonas haliclonae]|uniref:hypothetical protein n=1 Tax=Litorimonas haliclonae TaxID=2081977 RepID=UPI0039F10C96